MAEDMMATVRVLELMTRTGVEVIKLGSHCSVAAYLKIRDIYHAHVLDKAGEMTYKKLLKHVGSDIQILNFETEDPAEIDKIKETMTDYKISFTCLPDMSIGDGQSQFMIDASDASKAKAFLQNYTRISHRQMTADEYAATGSEEQWEELHQKAMEEKQKDLQNQMKDKSDQQAMEQSRTPAERAARSEKLIYIRRDDTFRQALQQPGSFQLSLNLTDMLAETSNTMVFRIGEDSKVFVIPKDYVRKESGRYHAVLLPERDYVTFGIDRNGLKADGRRPHERLNGDQIIDLFEQAKMQRAEKAADSIVKEISKEVVKEKVLQR